MVGAWIKKREIVDGVSRIRSEKLREHQYREYARSLEKKRLELDGESNVKHMWEQVKWAMVESAREVCGSVRVGGRNPKVLWRNDEVKAAVKRKEDSWKEVLGVEMKMQGKGVWKPTKRKNERLKGPFIKVRRRSKNSLEGR